MRKSKYLILGSLFFKFNDNLTIVDNITDMFDNENILDLIRFDKLSVINSHNFEYGQINFVYLPTNISTIKDTSFYHGNILYVNFSNCNTIVTLDFYTFKQNKISVVDLSDCIKLKHMINSTFAENQIKRLYLPDGIENIGMSAFELNNITYLNLSNCIKLDYIDKDAFKDNQIKDIIFSNSITTIGYKSFANNKIEYLDLTNCEQIESIDSDAFADNPLKEIKILNDTNIDYTLDIDSDRWKLFIKYYLENNQKSGDYKYENNQWKWYPLEKK